jgi:hypothetical protein
MVRLSRSTWIIALALLGIAGIFAAAAAYGSQSPGQASFDSDLSSFMLRSDSASLKIVRLQNGDAESQHLDEYSLGISDAALYKYISAVDKAHNARVSADAELQQAYIEVVVSNSEKRTIVRELGLEPTGRQEDSDYGVYSKPLEISGRYYALELMIPK